MQQPPNYPGSWQQQPNTQYPPQQWQSSPPNTYYPAQQTPPPGYQQSFQQPPMMPQPTPPPKKKSKVGLIVGIVVVLVLLSCVGAFAFASKGSNSGTTTSSIATSTSKTPATTATASTKHFKQTDAVQVGNIWDIEIISVKTSTGSEFNKPQKSGDVFLDFVIKVKNISSQEQDISSGLQFTLLDTTGQKYDLTIDTDAGSTLNGKVESNGLLQGSISYEVPSSVHNFTLGFEADIVSQGQVIWDIHV